MQHQFHLHRRDFVKQTSLGSTCWLASSTFVSEVALGQVPEGTDNRLVLLGLNALARAPERNYFADGHRGAGLVSAHLLCVDNNLDALARTRIVQLLDLNWASSELCKPFPDADANPMHISQIGEALMDGGKVLREVGHNAIFAMLAIKAFRLLPSAATPQRIDGVCRLIRAIKPWRDIEPDADVDPPPFTEAAAASKFILREAIAAVDRFVGFGQGFTGHMLTFGHALVELAAMGDVELAEGCRTAFRKYVTIVRRGPDSDAKRIPDHSPSNLKPRDAKYWQSRGDHAVDIGHVFKYPYSFYELLRSANDPELSEAWEAKAFHLF
jgi:hypothetical protein